MEEREVAVRRMWVAAEHIHLVTYFAPEAGAAYEAAGLSGFWRGYFGGRAAPMGAVGAGTVTATFYGFHPDFVVRAVPDVWSRAAPDALVEARREGASAALRRLLDGADEAALADVARRLDASLRTCAPGGRPLFAANLDVEPCADPLADLWQACTLWREHRGDGHVVSLTAAEIDGCESHVLRLAVSGHDGELMRAVRGWSDDDWDAAVERLVARGLVAAERVATDAGRSTLAEIEATTDRLASPPADTLGDEGVAAVLDVLEPLARRVRSAVPMPEPNPIGVPEP